MKREGGREREGGSERGERERARDRLKERRCAR